MSAYSSVLSVAVLLLHLWGTCSFPTSACPVPCLCQRGPLLNCSSLGLTTTPTRIPSTAVSLNLSNNALRSLAPLSVGRVKLVGLLHLWVGSNALESLSLILKKARSGTRTLSSGEQECTSWASDLQLLSAERNHLKRLPKGLSCIKSLQILQLSYNQISKIGLTDLDNCSNLKELHLQHNSITSIHPNAFIDLKQLQVLDLSYNLLVTIPVPAYQSLRNLNALVDVSFNRWKCDCNLQTLRRWISFDTEMGDVSWQVVCTSPPNHAGKDLLHLKDSELTCPTHEYSVSGHFHNMIVYEGMKISIPCSNDSKVIMQVHWWTPQGQVTNNQPELLIKDITEQHAGLYVCISGVRGEHISVFDLHVYKKGSGSRPRREAAIILNEQEHFNLPRTDSVVQQGTRSQSEFVLAVCLSVIITFILAFILGVFLRPLLDKLWRRIRSKRQSSPPPPPTTTSSTGPQLYVNEGYCDVEDQEQEVRVGSRVTFGGITVEDQVPYYVTVEDDQADGSSESNTEADTFYETIENNKSSTTGGKQQALDVENHRGRADSSSSSSLQEGEVNALVINSTKLPQSSTEDMPKSMEFESIPDANDITHLKRRGSSSASSPSSQDVNSSRELRESSVDPPPVTTPANKNTKGRIPGFTTEPFSEWLSRLTEQNVDDLDPELWNDSGESFSFTEGSERSSIRDLSSSALGQPLKDDDTWRQGKVESPSDKIQFDSEVFDKPFGKEVLVDDVKQFEVSDIASPSNSSDSGESVLGPNHYIVNTELEELESLDELDTENGANLVTLNRFSTLEDVTFNETMPSAGILIRQETITLEPSDIHLTFTHGNSVDEGMPLDDSQGNNEYVNISDKFAICVDVGLDTVPKVKRYVEFKQSKPHFGCPTLPSLSEMEVKSEANIDASSGENRSLSQIKVSPDAIQKVKRYIHFKQLEPHSPTLPSPPSLTKKDAMLEAKSYSSSSEDDTQLTTDDNFFRTIGVSSDEVSKVKRYISFKPFDSSSPTLSISRPSTNIETMTGATIKSMQPSTSPKHSSQNVKKYMHFKQQEHHSSSLPSSPTSSRKSLSGRKTKYKKQHDQSYYGSHESLPLYHVHPVYRSSINRLNRGYDTDRSISSEDEDQFMEYPRKLEITIPLEMNRGSITPDKNREKVLNMDFDNSSSSTDVFEKKHSKGLMRLRALSARLFNRHENETDERTSPTGLDVGRTSGVYINKQPKLTKEQTINEDGLFGRSLSLDHLPKVKRYLQFSHSDSHLQVQLPSPPPTTGVVTPEFILTTESRRSSFSSEDDVKQTNEDEKFVGQVDATYEGLPKVNRYIKFSYTEPCSTTLPLSKQTISTESRRPSTSSEDDIKPTSNEENVFRKIGVSLDTVQHVKRYIQFNQPKPYSPTLTSLPVSTKRPVVAAETSSSTSDKSDDKSDATGTFWGGQIGLNAVPKVKRYVQFTQSKPHSPPLPSVSSSSTKVTPKMEGKTEAKIDRSSGDQGYLTQIEVSPENIKKVKRYIHFKQSEPHSPNLPSSHFLTKKDAILETRRYSSSSEDDVQTTTNKDNFFRKIGFDGVSKVKGYITFKQFDTSSDTTSDALHVTPEVKSKSEARRSSTSSEDDVKLSAEEDNAFGQTGAYLDRVPRVKRYIQFTHPESQSPVQTTTGLLSERVNASVVAKETKRWSTSSDEDVKPSTKEENVIGETGEYLAEIPKVKRYIKFTQSEFPPSTVKPIKLTETEYRESTSSDDDFQEDNGKDFGKTGASLDRVPKVKRYIQFTHPESQSPVQTTTGLLSERVNASVVAKETRRWSTSSDEDIKPSTKEDNFIGETGEYLAEIPKVKRYIKFTQSEFPPGTVKPIKVTETEYRESTSSEDDFQEDNGKDFGKIGASLDSVPRVKRYIEFTHPESQFPAQTTALSAERANISVIAKEPRRSSTSSEDVKPSTNKDNIIEETSEYLAKIPKIKRYIKFTQTEQYSSDLSASPPSSTVKSIKVTETELRKPASRESTSIEVQEDNVFTQIGVSLDRVPKVKRYINFTHPESRSPVQTTTALSAERANVSVAKSTRRPSTSSEDDVKLSTNGNKTESMTHSTSSDNLDLIPRVKRYIHFIPAESQYPARSSTAVLTERAGISGVAQETRISSTSSKYVKPSSTDYNIIGETDKSFAIIPKVKKYIQFTQSEHHSSAVSSFLSSNTVKPINIGEVQEKKKYRTSYDDVKQRNHDNFFQEIGVSLDKIPKLKRYVSFTKSEPTSTKLMKRDFTPTTNAVEQTGLKSVFRKSSLSSLSSDKQSVGHRVMNVQPPQDVPPAVPQTSPPLLEQEEAREYLRENSDVLQRQERRRLLQQRRTEMDKFNIASLSSMHQEGDQQGKSPRDFGGATQLQPEQTNSSISTRNTATSRHRGGAEAPVLRGLKTKNKEFLI